MTIEWHYRWIRRWRRIRNEIIINGPINKAKVERCNGHIQRLSNSVNIFVEMIQKQKDEGFYNRYNFRSLVPLWKRALNFVAWRKVK
jgi:hypothetical protein